MNLNRKIKIDRFVGLPIAYFLNFLARILGFILKINHVPERDYKVIAVAKFLGLGSILQATPLLQTLKNNFPNSKIIFITSEENRILLSHFSFIDEVITLSDKKNVPFIFSVFSMVLKLWKRKIELYIDLEIYSNFSSIITTLSLATNRFGFYKSDRNYRMGMYTQMMFFNLQAPISEIYLQFSRIIGCTDLTNKLAAPQLSLDEKTMAKKKLNSLGLSDCEYIIINPNASELRLERRWEKNNFVAVIKKLLSDKKEFKIVLIGNKKEAEYVKSITEIFSENSNYIDTSGKLNLTEFIFLIEKSRLVFTNDTGPMHLAFAFQKNVVALFGPCSPAHYGQMGNATVLYKKVYCSPCVHEFLIPPCKGDNQCMKKINFQDAYAAIEKMLSAPEKKAEKNPISYVNEQQKPLGLIFR